MRRVLAIVILPWVVVLAVASCDARARAAFRYRKPPEHWTVPVQGVRGADIDSTWGAPRSGGRKHTGADIFAPKGTPVIAATNGVVLAITTDRLGGKVVYLFGEGLTIQYYAHLDAWDPALREGQHVKAGHVLGTVGNTGNAKNTPSHLHFGVSRVRPVRLDRVRFDPMDVLEHAETVPRESS
jgi:murein DD-endopeptidase MepM/ murein hydrolase activator NlpD